MENKEYYREEIWVKEMLTRRKSDEEIGMPDVEAELHRFHTQYGYKQNTEADRQPDLVIGKKRTSVWHRVAAIVTALLVVGGLSWAAAHFSGLFSSDSISEMGEPEGEVSRIDESAPALIIAPAPAEGQLVYDKAELGYIISQLTQRYGLDEPAYQQSQLAHIRLHATLPDSEDIQKPLEVLNHFGKFHLEVRDHRIYVLSVGH